MPVAGTGRSTAKDGPRWPRKTARSRRSDELSRRRAPPGAKRSAMARRSWRLASHSSHVHFVFKGLASDFTLNLLAQILQFVRDGESRQGRQPLDLVPVHWRGARDADGHQ